MATYTTEVKTTTEYRWLVPQPAPWVELNKAFGALSKAFKKEHGRHVAFDDDVMVTATEEHIVLSFTGKEGVDATA